MYTFGLMPCCCESCDGLSFPFAISMALTLAAASAAASRLLLWSWSSLHLLTRMLKKKISAVRNKRQEWHRMVSVTDKIFRCLARLQIYINIITLILVINTKSTYFFLYRYNLTLFSWFHSKLFNIGKRILTRYPPPLCRLNKIAAANDSQINTVATVNISNQRHLFIGKFIYLS